MVSKRVIWCPHGNCAIGCCTNCSSGHTSANLLIIFKASWEKQVCSGKDLLVHPMDCELIKFQGGESEVNNGVGTAVTHIAEEVGKIKLQLT